MESNRRPKGVSNRCAQVRRLSFACPPARLGQVAREPAWHKLHTAAAGDRLVSSAQSHRRPSGLLPEAAGQVVRTPAAACRSPRQGTEGPGRAPVPKRSLQAGPRLRRDRESQKARGFRIHLGARRGLRSVHGRVRHRRRAGPSRARRSCRVPCQNRTENSGRQRG